MKRFSPIRLISWTSHSYSSFEEEQGRFEVEDQTWSARDRTIIARTKRYLEESYSMKVEVEELEPFSGSR